VAALVRVSVIETLQLGLEEHRAGRLAAAEARYREVLAGDPDNADALHLLGVIELDRGRLESALASLGRAVELNGQRGEFHVNLGNALKTAGRLDEAIQHYRRAVQLMPLSAEVRNNYGAGLLERGEFEQAAASLRSALAIRGDYGEAHYNLATALVNLARYGEALGEYRRASALLPAHAGTWSNAGHAWHTLGEIETAVRCFRRAVSLRPLEPGLRTNLINAMRLVDDIGPKDELAECVEFDRRFARPLARTLPALERDASPERRLRVGYIGANGLRLHTASVTILPLVETHDPSRFEVYCYSDLSASQEDGVTGRYRAAAAAFHDTRALSDQALAERIRADRIDVLVDIIGYPQGSRLLAMARRAAPVQVNLLLMSSFGLGEVDWAISDATLTPAGSEAWFVERLHRIPLAFCYDPLGPTPEVTPPPSASGGGFVFGSMNQPAKLSARAIAAWCEILRAVPGSRLLLKGRAYGDAAVAEHVRGKFLRHGIGGKQLELRGWVAGPNAHWQIYREVDVALDPFPYGGVITTCEAMWSGVPVVSLAGNRVLGRYGVDFLNALGLAQCAAASEAEYVAHAVALASDPAGLAGLRAGLRQRMLGSALCNRAAYASAVEDGYRMMWREWCGRQ
jgi:predicted O-linked N-acetylglucosamine transferase (SPINDLY family)